HRLALDDSLDSLTLEDLEHDLVAFFGRLCPVDMDAVALAARLERLEQPRKVRERTRADRGAERAHLPPFLGIREGSGALGNEAVHRTAEVAPQLRVFEGLNGSRTEGRPRARRGHSALSHRNSAM